MKHLCTLEQPLALPVAEALLDGVVQRLAHRGHQVLEHAIVRRLDDGQVQAQVERVVAVGLVQMRVHLGHDGAHALQLCLASPLGGEHGRVHLDALAHLHELGDGVSLVLQGALEEAEQRIARDGRDARAAAVAHLDHAGADQRLHRLAQDRAADAEALGQLRLRRQLVAGHEPVAPDLCDQLGRDPVGQRAAVESGGVGGHGRATLPVRQVDSNRSRRYLRATLAPAQGPAPLDE